MSLREEMIKWLRTQDPNATYTWVKFQECACALFSKSIGREVEWRDEMNKTHSVWWELDHLAMPLPHTFGALLKRLGV